MKKYSWIRNSVVENVEKFKAILIVFSFYILLGPHSGIFDENVLNIFNLKKNWLSISDISIDIHPIIFSFNIILYQLAYIFEFLFPKLWGSENYFFVRLLFKLPLMISLVVSAFLLQTICKNISKNEKLSNLTFYFQLFNLPLLYSIIILENTVIIPFTLFLLMVTILQINSGSIDDFTSIFLSGCLSGLVISFNIVYFVIIIPFILLLTYKYKFIMILSSVTLYLLIKITWGNLINIDLISYDTKFISDSLNNILFNQANLISIIILYQLLMGIYIIVSNSFDNQHKLLFVSTILINITIENNFSIFLFSLLVFVYLIMIYYSNETYLFLLKIKGKNIRISAPLLILILLNYLIAIYLLGLFPIFELINLELIQIDLFQIINGMIVTSVPSLSILKMLFFVLLIILNIKSLINMTNSLKTLIKHKYIGNLISNLAIKNG